MWSSFILNFTRQENSKTCAVLHRKEQLWRWARPARLPRALLDQSETASSSHTEHSCFSDTKGFTGLLLMSESTRKRKHGSKESCWLTKGYSEPDPHIQHEDTRTSLYLAAQVWGARRAPTASQSRLFSSAPFCCPCTNPVALFRLNPPQQTAEMETPWVPKWQHAGDLPDGSRLIPFIEPVLRWDYVHAPEAPVVAVGCVGVLLHFKSVVLDIVNGW